MNIATATTRPQLTAAQCWLEVETRNIALTPAFDGRVWLASIERVKNKKKFTRADMEVISATGPTALDAVGELVAMLDSEVEQRELWEEEDAA
jgi:hypothetical protein